MESFLDRQTAYGYGGQDNKTGTAESATIVQTSGGIRDFHSSGDKKHMDNIFYKSRISGILHST